MSVKSGEGTRTRNPFLRGTFTLTLPGFALLLLLIVRKLCQAPPPLLTADIDVVLPGETGVGETVYEAPEPVRPEVSEYPEEWMLEEWMLEGGDASETVYEAPEPDRPRPEVSVYPEEWMLEARATMAHVDNNISRYQRRGAFDASFRKLRHGFIVRIEDGRIYARAKMLPGTAGALHPDWNERMVESGQPVEELRQVLWPLCRRGLVDDPRFQIDFIVSVTDEPLNTVQDEGVPAFGWVKTAFNTDLLIPYPYTYNFLFSPLFAEAKGDDHIGRLESACYNKSLAHVNEAWDAKIDRGIWRGSTTGTHRFTVENWREQRRSKLVKYCMDHGDACDAAISGTVQIDSAAVEEMQREIPIGEAFRLDEQAQARYKYLMMVDGNSAPSSRMLTALGEASLIIKQSSPFMEFYYHSLRPYHHYLPMPSEIGEDISHVINWARGHDEEIRQMVVRALSFKCRWLHDDVVEQYVADLIQMYAERFQGRRGSIKTQDMIPLHVDCTFNRY